MTSRSLPGRPARSPVPKEGDRLDQARWRGPRVEVEGRLVVHKATCTTRLRFALPRSYAGSKVKVVLTFPGNTAVRAFTRSSKLRIKKP